MDTEKIASLSQKEDDSSFRLRPIRAQDLDLGSREILKDETVSEKYKEAVICYYYMPENKGTCVAVRIGWVKMQAL